MEKNKGYPGKLIGERSAAIFVLWSIYKDAHILLKKIGLESRRVYRQVPDECYACEGRDFDDLSLIGIHDKPVFYECIQCGALHLKYTKKWIESQFDSLKGCFSNINDWEDNPSKEDYN